MKRYVLAAGILFLSIFEAQSAVIRLDFEGEVTQRGGIFQTVPDENGLLPKLTGSLYFDTAFRNLVPAPADRSNFSSDSNENTALSNVWGIDIQFGSISKSTRDNSKTLTPVPHHFFSFTDSPGGTIDPIVYIAEGIEITDDKALFTLSVIDLISSGGASFEDSLTIGLFNAIADNFNSGLIGINLSSNYEAYNIHGSKEGFIFWDTTRLSAVLVDDGGVTPVPLPASLPLLAGGFVAFGILARCRKRVAS